MPPIEERRAEFIKRYQAIMEELKIDLYSYPLYVPDGNGAFKVVIQTDLVDIADAPTPSPFSA